jgi:quercetin dioxygenase-like cupin family protein
MNKAPELSKKKIDDLMGKADKALAGLRQKVRDLPHMPPVINDDQGTREFKVGDGKALAWALWTEPKVSVARWFSKANTQFPDHAHQEREWLIVYSGEIRVRKEDGSEEIVREGECIFLPDGVVHGGYSLVDAYFIGVTIPKSPYYPE